MIEKTWGPSSETFKSAAIDTGKAATSNHKRNKEGEKAARKTRPPLISDKGTAISGIAMNFVLDAVSVGHRNGGDSMFGAVYQGLTRATGISADSDSKAVYSVLRRAEDLPGLWEKSAELKKTPKEQRTVVPPGSEESAVLALHSQLYAVIWPYLRKRSEAVLTNMYYK